MALTNIEELKKEANQYVENPDVIIDVLDMTYTWVSQHHCDLTEYSEEEQKDIRVSAISQLVDGDSDRIALETTPLNERFRKKMIVTTKSGKKKNVEVEGIIIEYNNQPYIIGKIAKED